MADENMLQPSAAYRQFEQVARARGLREAFVWIPTILLLVGIIVYNAQNPIVSEKAIFFEWSEPQQNFIRVLSEGDDYTKNQLVVEKSLISYMVNREKIDHATEKARFENVYAQSSDEIWQTFNQTYLSNDESLVYREGFYRDIKVERTPNFVDAGIIQIEYTTTDKQDNEIIRSETWVATITFEFIELQVSFDRRYNNVLGLNVTDYQISKRGKTDVE